MRARAMQCASAAGFGGQQRNTLAVKLEKLYALAHADGVESAIATLKGRVNAGFSDVVSDGGMDPRERGGE